MPSDLVGLLIFVTLLMPGFVFLVQREIKTPNREISAFRETVTLAVVSLACNAVAVALFGLVRFLFPAQTPDFGRMVRDGFSYILPNYIAVGWWGIALLAFSSILAFMLGRFEPTFTRSFTQRITFTSAWWELFHMHADSKIYVGCELEDNSYLGGYLLSYSTEVKETGDRELAISAPITCRLADGTEAELHDISAVTVSARRLKYHTVSYMDASEKDSAK